MILTVDVGNSNIVMGLFDEGELKKTIRTTTNKKQTVDEYHQAFQLLFVNHQVDVKHVVGCMMASVVPSLTNIIAEALKRWLVCPIGIVGAGVKTGLNIQIDDPSELGADLVAGAVAAMQTYQLPSLIIDLGTATTLVVVDEQGAFLGGAICPGVATSMHALIDHASQLLEVPLSTPKKVIGKNTISSIQSGVIIGAASMLDGMITRFEKEINTKLHVVVTGGLATIVAPSMIHAVILDEDLVLKGLYALYIKNNK